MNLAKLFPSKLLRTTAAHRPYPSLFFMPGLTQKPFYDPKDKAMFPFVQDFEENLHHIQREYLSLRKAYESMERDDYHKIDGEEVLDSTKKKELDKQRNWHWMSYIQKGQKIHDFEQVFE